jgi:hypothetical protein
VVDEEDEEEDSVLVSEPESVLLFVSPGGGYIGPIPPNVPVAVLVADAVPLFDGPIALKVFVLVLVEVAVTVLLIAVLVIVLVLKEPVFVFVDVEVGSSMTEVLELIFFVFFFSD